MAYKRSFTIKGNLNSIRKKLLTHLKDDGYVLLEQSPTQIKAKKGSRLASILSGTDRINAVPTSFGNIPVKMDQSRDYREVTVFLEPQGNAVKVQFEIRYTWMTFAKLGRADDANRMVNEFIVKNWSRISES